MFYEIINPSDETTFEAPNLMVASLVTILLGGGQYGAKPEDPEAEEVPLMLFGGAEVWWAEHFDEPMEGAVDRHAGAVSAALRTVCYGGIDQRRLYDSAMRAIDDPDKAAAFIEEWNDRNRSSMNNIMGRAHAIADKLDGRLEPAA